MDEYKVSVLGTEYTVKLTAKGDDPTFEANGCNGYTDTSSKKIVVMKGAHDMDPEPGQLDDIVAYRKRVLRHEIVHAFMFESGLDDQSQWAQNEELIDWIAIQIKKMSKAMSKAESTMDECYGKGKGNG